MPGQRPHPYLTGVDLTGVDLSGPAPTTPAFKCSCPSRKLPCKHALALLLLHATHADSFGQAAPPEPADVAGRPRRAGRHDHPGPRRARPRRAGQATRRPREESQPGP
ncbi:SWIM zinc finger family protein [Deinococcus caeni]|uniref:SWIM zinc finger family protein n=1 Tax=Deinococcus caeni TaxID=569127 RepID=UPI00361ECD39